MISESLAQVALFEEVFIGLCPRSGLKHAQVFRVLMASALNSGMIIAEYSLRLVRQAMTGFGVVEKAPVQFMVRQHLQLPQVLQADETDALAIALTHLIRCNHASILRGK